MNPLTQRVLMSAAQKRSSESGWNVNSTGTTRSLTAGGLDIGSKVIFGNDSGEFLQQQSDGSWKTFTQLRTLQGAVPVNKIKTIGIYTYVLGSGAYVRFSNSGSPETGLFSSNSLRSDANWTGTVLGFPTVYNILSIESSTNTNIVVIGGQNGSIATSTDALTTYTTAKAPGSAGQGGLANIIQIIKKNIDGVLFDEDTKGWWLFYSGGGYVHTLGINSGTNPNNFAEGTYREDLKTLLQSGETLVNAELINNKFVVLTSKGRIFLSYTGLGYWEERTTISNSGNTTTFQDAFFDGQNYNILAKIDSVPTQVQVLSYSLGTFFNAGESNEYGQFIGELTGLRPTGSFIFYGNGLYYIGSANGEYLTKQKTVTVLNKSVVEPMVLTASPNVNLDIYFDFANESNTSIFAAEDTVVLNDNNVVKRAKSMDQFTLGTTVTKISSAILATDTQSGATITFKKALRLTINTGASGKIRIFGRRFTFQLSANFDPLEENVYNVPVLQINKWGTFLNTPAADGMFANCKNLTVIPAGFIQTSSLNAMFAKCYKLNSFPNLDSSGLSGVRSAIGTFFQCREFNQPIGSNGGSGNLNFTFCSDFRFFLAGAIKFNNEVRIILPTSLSAVIDARFDSMFSGCLALQTKTSIENFNFGIAGSNLRLFFRGMFNNCIAFRPTQLNWSTSQVVDMSYMFYGCGNTFNPSLPWATNNVTNMSNMFRRTGFNNSSIVNWNTTKVLDMSYMFAENPNFNQNIGTSDGKWIVNLCENMSGMFFNATAFNGDIEKWTVGSVKNMDYMFKGATSFNRDLLYMDPMTSNFKWVVNKVTSMVEMFSGATLFNGDISSWFKNYEPNAITNTSFMFFNASNFNRNLNSWDTKTITNMSGMFTGATSFGLNAATLFGTNNIVSAWNTSNVTDMRSMFNGAIKFNSSLSNWNVEKVTNMENMFNGAREFNGSLSNWKPYNVVTMRNMFYDAVSFNQPLTPNVATRVWDVSKVRDMSSMFYANPFLSPTFNNGGLDTIKDWNTASVTNMNNMFYNAREFNQPISNWNTANVTNMYMMFNGAKKFNQPLYWNVGKVTDMGFMFANTDVFNGDITSWRPSQATSFFGMFNNAKAFNQPIGQWGSSTGLVTNMSSMFNGATLFNQPLDGWNTSKVTNMSNMFQNAINFNSSISSWDTAQVRSMDSMFFGATKFNQPIDSSGGTIWNVSNVTIMRAMFRGATSFNQSISSWSTGSVGEMAEMFYGATQFNQFISLWNTSNVTNFSYMFYNATSFNNGGLLFDRYYSPYLGKNTGFDTSRATNMTGMFYLSNFQSKYYYYTVDELFGNQEDYVFPRSQKISSWCVSTIPSQPTDFGMNVGTPIWGTCPTPRSGEMFSKTITSNIKEMDLRNWAVSQGWDTVATVSIIIDPGVYIWSDNRNIPGLNISGSFPNGVRVYNKGNIIGKGGMGASYFYYRNGLDYTTIEQVLSNVGGNAMHIKSNDLWLRNDGYIAGGGGGGVGLFGGGGGGAGGGRGNPFGINPAAGYPVYGGDGGAPGQKGADGGPQPLVTTWGMGGGGGRILPGVGGAAGIPSSPGGKGGGAGGGAGGAENGGVWQGGAGGSADSQGGDGGAGAGGGGGWGAAGGLATGSGGNSRKAGGLSINYDETVTTLYYEGGFGNFYGGIGYRQIDGAMI